MDEKSLDKVIEKIGADSGRNPDEIKKLITEKQDELSGLVSREGAAYIVGRELGVSLLRESNNNLKVNSLTSGLRSVDMILKISRIMEPREFTTKDGKNGKVQNVIVGDETGTVRLSFWNDELEKVKELKEGEAIKITRGYVKMDNVGNPELRIGRGMLEKSKEDIQLPKDLPESGRTDNVSAVLKRAAIKNLKEGDFGEIRACFVQVYKKAKPFYEVCPECGGRLRENDGKWECKEHGAKEPDYHMVVGGVLDDGTGNIRAVFFRDMAEKMAGKPAKELKDEAQEKMSTDFMYEEFPNLGKEFIFRGRVKKNEMTEDLELTVSSVEEVDSKKEVQGLLKD